MFDKDPCTEDAAASSSCRYTQQLPSLIKQALALSGTGQLKESVASITGSDARTVPVSARQPEHTDPLSTSAIAAAPSWLTPQQLQNRQLGEPMLHCLQQSCIAKGFGSEQDPNNVLFVLPTASLTSFASAFSHHLTKLSSACLSAGTKVAKMMSSHRTPIGAFANFDMPVAP